MANKDKHTAAKIYLAKRYGTLHGYKGKVGGWIYDRDGQPVVANWATLYTRYAVAIRGWALNVTGLGHDARNVDLAKAMYRKQIVEGRVVD